MIEITKPAQSLDMSKRIAMKKSLEKTALREMIQNRSEQGTSLQKLRGVITTFALFCVMLLLLPGLSYAATNLYAGGSDGAAPLAADGSQVLVYSITASKNGAGGQPFATAFGITINGSVANASRFPVTSSQLPLMSMSPWPRAPAVRPSV
jgi:hypothetical protein